MKNHFLSLFDPVHRWWTISFFLASVILFIFALLVGITDNFPGIGILLGAVICLFLTVLHPWRKWENYAIMAGIFCAIIFLIWVTIHILASTDYAKFLSEALIMIIIFFICIPGIILGILGSIFWAIRNK